MRRVPEASRSGSLLFLISMKNNGEKWAIYFFQRFLPVSITVASCDTFTQSTRAGVTPPTHVLSNPIQIHLHNMNNREKSKMSNPSLLWDFDSPSTHPLRGSRQSNWLDGKTHWNFFTFFLCWLKLLNSRAGDACRAAMMHKNGENLGILELKSQLFLRCSQKAGNRPCKEMRVNERC